MRYTVFLLAFMLLFSYSFATASSAEGMSTEQEVHSGDAPCPMMGDRGQPCDGPCGGECQGPRMGEGPGMMGPGEGMWYDRPWNIWRHLDEGSLDYDAIHFMSDVRTVAILPFADMTVPTYQGESVLVEAGGARRIVENLAGALMNRGYLVVPPTDSEAVLNAYFRGAVLPTELTDETANNQFWFQNLPDRALSFYMTQVNGMEEQSLRLYSVSAYSVAPNDIKALAESLGADCIIRGFVQEFALDEDVDADLRTLFPPFLGLFNPDVRLTFEVAYYIYDGATGELVWNGTFSMRHDEEWPMFNSKQEAVARAEVDAVSWFVDKTIPNWMDLVMAHPEWVPFNNWYEMRDGHGRMFEQHPDWLNPYRNGWHGDYDRSGWRLDMHEPVMNNPHRRLRYDGLTHYYQGLHTWRQRVDSYYDDDDDEGYDDDDYDD
jgi:hypothetical protein